MDGFSSQTANGFEDKIRQMLNNDKPNVRLPPAANLPQHPSAGTQSHGGHGRAASWDRYGASSPLSPQGPIPPPGMMPSGPLPPSQQFPPHLRYQGSHNPSNQILFSGPRSHGGHPQYRTPPMGGPYPPQGQQPVPNHPRGPPPQLNGQSSRGHHYPSQRGPPRHQGNYQPLDPEAFIRGGSVRSQARPALFDPNARSRQSAYTWNDARQRQAEYLDQIVANQVPSVDMTQAERDEKDAFRQTLDDLCQQVCAKNPNLPRIKLECFGSFASGFASAGSDMDLVVVVQNNESTSAVFSLLEDDLPRSLEDALLRAGHGARLLTRTRVPIIKVCQSPSTSFLDKLREEREKWDFLPNEKKYPHLFPREEDENEEDPPQVNGQTSTEQKTLVTVEAHDGVKKTVTVASSTVTEGAASKHQNDNGISVGQSKATTATTAAAQTTDPQNDNVKREQVKTWTRERKAGPLDFPKDGVGIQCDVNFFNPLGLHNTHMLRCYSLCDPRVRPMVLFVKAWARLRRINSSYSGTLSSYGYVMMILHYLMNIAQPPVIPNLQLPWRPNAQCTPQSANKTTVDDWVVDFWRNEDEIQAAFRNGQMSASRESLGSLLAGFFQYYSSMSNGPQFHWMQQIISLRTPGGILTKEEKGWVKATTEEGEGKKIQHRYLFCIEDPFELTHNVARTVTHNGIVAIRDEFRRAQRILYSIGSGYQPRDGELFTLLIEAEDLINATTQLKLEAEVAPAGAVNQRSEQKRGRKPQQPQTNGDIQDDATQKPRRPAPKQQQKKQLNVADQDAFPTLGSASNKKQGNGKRGGHNGKKQTLDHKKATTAAQEAQGEETSRSAVEFLGL